jgi:lysyl-tRNA synthetase class 2
VALASIRHFFLGRGVIEVETPLLSHGTVSDVYLSALRCGLHIPGEVEARNLYLQTSPEFAMKRLLAAGSGDIYQICKAFRNGESGRLHNPEFTILEWYRIGFDHHRLMDEVDDLDEELQTRASELVEQPPELEPDDRDGWLNLLHTSAVEPHLGIGRPEFVFDYPASQAALAKLNPKDPRLAERFEVYVEGVELANGYHELADPTEHRRRFETDCRRREALGLPVPPLDERLLEALEHGLPPCAGIALGVDRLLMLAADATGIDRILSFPIDRA